jgi:hypothetical protein
MPKFTDFMKRRGIPALVASLSIGAVYLGWPFAEADSSPTLPASATQVVKGYTGAEVQEKFAVTRFLDKDANVLCYVTTTGAAHGNATSISCVPGSRTYIGRDGKIYP